MPTRARLDRRRPPDLRLVAPAVAAWAVVLVGILAGPAVAVGADRAGRGVLRCCSVRRGCPALVRAVAGCALAAGVVVTAHAWLLAAEHPLRAAAERGAAATVRVQLRDDPHPIRAAGVRRPAGRRHPGPGRRHRPAGRGRRRAVGGRRPRSC